MLLAEMLTILTFWRRNKFLILAHPVYKMWIIQEPNTLELWKKLHFGEKKTESIYRVKNIHCLYLLNKYIKCNFRGKRCGTTTIVDIRRQKVNNVTHYCYGSTKCVVLITYLCDLFNFNKKRIFNLNLKQAKCCYVFVFSCCIIYLLYSTKTYVSCCRYVQWKRTGMGFVEFLKSFRSSKAIFRITTLLYM